MSHRVGVAKPMFSLGGTAMVVAIAVALLCAGVAAYRLPSLGSSAGVGGIDAYRMLNVGPTDEVEVKIPILHWVMFEPDKNIIVRRPDGEFFLETPDRRLYQFNKKTGKYDTEVPNFGTNVSKVYLRSAGGIAQVERSFVRGELNPVVPTPPAPALPATGATL